MSLLNSLPNGETLETFKDNFNAYSTIRWSPDGEIRSWVQHFTNEEASQYHRKALTVYRRSDPDWGQGGG